MKFICPRHRQRYTEYPERARDMWYHLMTAASESVLQGDWQEAVYYFGNALDLAELVLDLEPSSSMAQERYASTALDMAYVLKASKMPVDWLLAAVAERLSDRHITDPVSELWQSLRALEKPVADKVLPLWQSVARSNVAAGYPERFH
ncbi:MAG: hypothetical protein AseanaTS_08270 [Candidatus Pelagadaptatus aseana]|uniref:hypothetical protein n=1 Tax=Candidatus Pelagadaptatus aseana TaxID=3120508 RepID=UPI0039B2CEB9